MRPRHRYRPRPGAQQHRRPGGRRLVPGAGDRTRAAREPAAALIHRPTRTGTVPGFGTVPVRQKPVIVWFGVDNHAVPYLTSVPQPQYQLLLASLIQMLIDECELLSVKSRKIQSVS